MLGAIGVAAIFAMGCWCVYVWWRAKDDPAYWRKVSAHASAGGTFSHSFALAGTRRLWILGLGLMIQSLSGSLSAIIRNARGTNSGTTSAKVLGVTLMVGTAINLVFFAVAFVEKRRYKDADVLTSSQEPPQGGSQG